MFLLAQTSPTAGSLVRKPSLKVLLNGSTVLPAISAEVTNNSHFTSDSFRVECSLSAMPSAFGAAYWAASQGDQVQISVGVGSGNPVPLILGQVDNAEIDLIRKTVALTGRDLSASFIDKKTTDKFQNQTSSQIALTLATRHKLQANIAATKTKVGTYYAVDQVSLAREESEWDLLIYLAQHEGYDLWVSGNTLNFQPSLNLSSGTPYLLMYSAQPSQFASFTDLKMSRSQTLARDIIVIVRSWNQVQQKVFQVTYKRTQANKGQRAGGQAQTYSYTVPNLTQQGALNYAMQKAEEISRQERILQVELPGDVTLNIRTPVKLVGTGTAFDQTYYPDTIKREISFEKFRMSLRAKNHSPQSTVIL